MGVTRVWGPKRNAGTLAGLVLAGENLTSPYYGAKLGGCTNYLIVLRILDIFSQVRTVESVPVEATDHGPVTFQAVEG